MLLIITLKKKMDDELSFKALLITRKINNNVDSRFYKFLMKKILHHIYTYI